MNDSIYKTAKLSNLIWKNSKISSFKGKLLACFFLIVIIYSMLTFYVFNKMYIYNNEYDRILLIISNLNNISNSVEKINEKMLSLSFVNNHNEFLTYEEFINNEILHVHEQLNNLEKTNNSLIMDRILVIQYKFNAFELSAKQLIELKKNNDTNHYIEVNLHMKESALFINDYVNELTSKILSNNEEKRLLIYDGFRRIKATIIFAFSIILVGSCTLIIVFSNIVAESIKKVCKMLKNISNGNLTEVDIQFNTNDEISELANTTIIMKNNLRVIIKKSIESSTKLVSLFNVLNKEVEESNIAIGGISKSVMNVNGKMSQNVTNMQNSEMAIKKITSVINEVIDDSKVVRIVSKEASKSSGEGLDSIENIVKQIYKISDTINEVNNKTSIMMNNLNGINSFVDLINRISSQTNLLSLNASIEAAKAGDYGLGFTVVAQEIRSLADETFSASKRIRQIIEKVSEDSKNMAIIVEKSMEEIGVGLVLSDVVSSSFSKINDSNQKVEMQTKKIDLQIEDIRSFINDVQGNSSKTLDTIRISFNEINQISISIDQQYSTLEKILKSSLDIKELSEKTKQLVNKFEI